MDLLSAYSDDETETEPTPLPLPFVPQETYSDESDEEDDCVASDTMQKSINNVTDAQCSEDSDTDIPESTDRFDLTKFDSKSTTGGNSVDAYVSKMKIPILNQVELGGHSKAVSCLSYEPAGNRVVTGSLDYTVKIFDFGGMDSRHRAFKSLEAQESHMVSSISHSPSGDKFIVATGSAQPIVYDRDGKTIIKFVKGDMYLRDLSNTKGHTMEVTGVHWHPAEKNIILTSSLDGSLRIWDLLGEAAFGNLTNKHVLKIRGATGVQRVGATCCCYSADGSRIVGGAADGTVHVWNQKKIYSRADIVLKLDNSRPVCSVAMGKNNNRVAVRHDGGTVVVWDLLRPKAPMRVWTGVVNDYPTANIDFSPDGSLICCGTSPISSTTSAQSSSSSDSSTSEAKSRLCFFDVDSDLAEPSLSIAVAAGISAIMVKWQPNTNQIFCSLSSGAVRVLYDPSYSKKGAMLSASKAPRREKDPSDYALVGEIQNPHALPMYRNDVQPNLKRKMDLKDPVKAKIPYQPPTQGPGAKENTSFFFTNFVMSERKADTSRTEDPREALLRVDQEAKSDPLFLGRAYGKSQPQNILHNATFEQEQEQFKKKQKEF